MLSNWTKATTTTTGTGTITLSAVSGRPLPSAAHAVGELVEYSINTSDGKFEAGVGTIAASETLERTRVNATYDGSTYNKLTASALSLASGTHTVYVTPIASIVQSAAYFPFTQPTNKNVISTHYTATQSNAGTAAANRNTAWPFRLETAGLCTSMSVNVSVTGASSTLLLGLYEPRASDGWPGRLLCKTSATISGATTGFKSQALVSNVYLSPGWYWAAIVVTAGSNPQYTGGTVISHAFGSTGKDVIYAIREDASASDLADPFPSSSKVSEGGNTGPYIGLILS